MTFPQCVRVGKSTIKNDKTGQHVLGSATIIIVRLCPW